MRVALGDPKALSLVMTRALMAILIALAACGVIGTVGVQASCAGPPSVQEQVTVARLVFVGTVVFTSDNDREARVRVESIWKGPNLRAYVDVHGSPVSGSFSASSVDRTYRAGERDLFVLFSDREPFQDNSCSATQPYTAELSTLAPADARPPAPATPGDQIANLLGQYWLPIVIAILVVLVGAFAGFRRRFTAGRSRSR
jgi:hypothetical protein